MQFLSLLLFCIIVFSLYLLVGVLIRFIRRVRYIRKMKKRINSMMEVHFDDGSDVS